MKIAEIEQIETKDLHQKLKDLRTEVAKLKLNIKIGKEVQSHKMHQMKKDIARVLSVINKKN